MCVRLSSTVFAFLLSAKRNSAQTHASCQALHSFVTQALSRGNVPFGMCISYIDTCICSREPRTKRSHFSVEEECENLFSRSRVCGFLLDLSGPGHGPLSRSSNELCALSDSERLKEEVCLVQMAHEVNSMNY